MWCTPQVAGEYVARMEDVLDLYAEPPDPKRPVVCSTRAWSSSSARRARRSLPCLNSSYDCEYKRNGTANLFILIDAHRLWRRVKVTDSRAAVDFAARMRELCEVHFRKAERIRVVLDNLSTHSAGALHRPPKRAACCAGWSSTTRPSPPADATWWREVGVMRSQCLDRRIATKAHLSAEVAARERHRNALGARIHDVHNPQGPSQNGPGQSPTRRIVTAIAQ